MKLKRLKSILESSAHETAAKLGLDYYKFGRYGRDGVVTHTNESGRLVPVKKTIPANSGVAPVTLHYTHLEDHSIEQGVAGIQKTINTLHKIIKGVSDNNADQVVQTKVDGSPSVFFGVHPDNGKFFVATKSLHNKTPIYIQSHEDVDRIYKNKPGLAKKMHAAIKYLPGVFKNTKNIMQGDIMFTSDDVVVKDIDGVPHYTFKGNTVRNAVPVKSDEGEKIGKAKFGVSVHSKYNAAGEVTPIDPEKDVGKSDSEVYLFSSTFSPTDLREFLPRLQKLGSIVSKTPRSTFDYVSSDAVKNDLLRYLNKTIRSQETPTYQGLVDFVDADHQRKIDGLVMAKSKDKAKNDRDARLSDLEKNRDHIVEFLKLHHVISSLKNDIIATLDKNQTVKRFFDDPDSKDKLIPTGPEGYVTFDNSGITKLVNRREFSFQNFTSGPRQKEKAAKKAVVTLGRMSPPHIEHSNLIDAVLTQAKKTGADPFVFVTHTQDNKKNPLTGDEKLAVLKKMYPKNTGIFHGTSKNMPSLPAILADLTKKGYKQVEIVIGDDRKDEFKRLIDYNNKKSGSPDKFSFAFDDIKVLSRHEINNTKGESDGDGIHASDVRRAAVSGDFSTVRAAMHPNLSDDDVRTLMNTIKQRLSTPERKLREQYITGSLFNVGDVVVSRQKKKIYEIVQCGSNYLSGVDVHGDIEKLWLTDVVPANTLKDHFLHTCTKESTMHKPNQLTFVGYTTKNFTPEIVEAFSTLLDGDNQKDKFVRLSILRNTDKLLELMQENEMTPETFQDAMSLYEQTDRLLRKNDLIEEHSNYRSSIFGNLVCYALIENVAGKIPKLTSPATPAEKMRAARTIALAVGSDQNGKTPEEIVNAALQIIKTGRYPRDAWNMIGRMLVLFTSLGIEWDRSILMPNTLKRIGAV